MERDRRRGQGSETSDRSGHHGPAPGKRALTHRLSAPVQLARLPAARARPDPSSDGDDAGAIAAGGLAEAFLPLPHGEAIQRSFGRHDVGAVRASIGGAAASAADALGADAYAHGDGVAFREAPDLHLAAHEAAHVVQQRGGVQLAGGVGAAGDAYERHADAVADAVVRGGSAEALLDAGPGGGGGGPAVQRRVTERQGDRPTRALERVRVPESRAAFLRRLGEVADDHMNDDHAVDRTSDNPSAAALWEALQGQRGRTIEIAIEYRWDERHVRELVFSLPEPPAPPALVAPPHDRPTDDMAIDGATPAPPDAMERSAVAQAADAATRAMDGADMGITAWTTFVGEAVLAEVVGAVLSTLSSVVGILLAWQQGDEKARANACAHSLSEGYARMCLGFADVGLEQTPLAQWPAIPAATPWSHPEFVGTVAGQHAAAGWRAGLDAAHHQRQVLAAEPRHMGKARLYLTWRNNGRLGRESLAVRFREELFRHVGYDGPFTHGFVR
jgi:hypothetical protein